MAIQIKISLDFNLYRKIIDAVIIALKTGVQQSLRKLPIRYPWTPEIFYSITDKLLGLLVTFVQRAKKKDRLARNTKRKQVQKWKNFLSGIAQQSQKRNWEMEKERS